MSRAHGREPGVRPAPSRPDLDGRDGTLLELGHEIEAERPIGLVLGAGIGVANGWLSESLPTTPPCRPADR